MKILILNYEFPPLGGGAANATYYLLKEFAKYKDLEIDLVTSSVGKFKKEKFAKNITIHYLDIGKNNKNLHYQSNKNVIIYSWNAYRYSKKLMNNKQYDLAHAFFGIPCGYLAMKLGLPYIVSLRGSDVPFYNKRFEKMDKLLFKRISKRVWKKSKATITNSEGLKDLALKSSPKQKISIIYNGVDTETFKPLIAKRKNEKLTLISTGRLIERKGYQYLIPALTENEELWLVGEGNILEELKNLAQNSKGKVKFLGRKNQEGVIEYLRKADIFVLPSKNEGMSNSVLEAMACGLPIITTNTGGSKELIKGNGFIVKMESSKELRKAIEKYKNTPSLLEYHGKKSRELAKNLSWNNMAKKYYEVYDD